MRRCASSASTCGRAHQDSGPRSTCSQTRSNLSRSAMKRLVSRLSAVLLVVERFVQLLHALARDVFDGASFVHCARQLCKSRILDGLGTRVRFLLAART